jgi:hypothetical protein
LFPKIYLNRSSFYDAVLNGGELNASKKIIIPKVKISAGLGSK